MRHLGARGQELGTRESLDFAAFWLSVESLVFSTIPINFRFSLLL